MSGADGEGRARTCGNARMTNGEAFRCRSLCASQLGRGVRAHCPGVERAEIPCEAAFYTSGRCSNEAAFVYQLFARAYGTNNLHDCSNMCHESSGEALSQTIGVGKGSVSLDDIVKADLILVVGQNPGTNHPCMLGTLEEAKEAGASIVCINPLPEAGHFRFKNPQRINGVVGRGTELCDQFLQIRVNGDLALFQSAQSQAS